MRKILTTFLQSVVVIVGLCAIIALLVEPHFEGRNVNATLFEIYFKDPFLAYIYIASTPFFIALYQGFKLIDYLKYNLVFSQIAISRLRIISICALIFASAIFAADVYLFIFMRGKDDITGGLMLGLIIALLSLGVAIVAKKLNKTIAKQL